MSYKIGDTLRIPFLLTDADGVAQIDLVAGNYTWPLSKDGAAVASPSFTVTRPDAARNDLLLTYPLTARGVHASGQLVHATAGYSTDFRKSTFKVTSSDIDDVMAGIAVPAAAPTNTVFRVGDKLFIVRGDDWVQTFTLFMPDGVTPRDITGWTFQFRLGLRTAASDSYLYNQSGIAPLSPTAGTVQVTIPNATTGAFTIGADQWYDLQGTDGSAKKSTRGLGPCEIVRDVGPSP